MPKKVSGAVNPSDITNGFVNQNQTAYGLYFSEDSKRTIVKFLLIPIILIIGLIIYWEKGKNTKKGMIIKGISIIIVFLLVAWIFVYAPIIF